MTSRRINLETPVLPDPQRYAWIEANGIDPSTVPAAQEVLVEDGKLTFIQFALNAEGQKQVRDDGYEKVLRTVPLISAPENHGL
jgi:hypothetical protein